MAEHGYNLDSTYKRAMALYSEANVTNGKGGKKDQLHNRN